MTLELVLRMAMLPCWPGSLPTLPGQGGDGRFSPVFESLDSGVPLLQQPGLCLITSSDIWHFCCLPLTCLRGQGEPLFAKVDSSTPSAPLLYL